MESWRGSRTVLETGEDESMISWLSLSELSESLGILFVCLFSTILPLSLPLYLYNTFTYLYITYVWILVGYVQCKVRTHHIIYMWMWMWIHYKRSFYKWKIERERANMEIDLWLNSLKLSQTISHTIQEYISEEDFQHVSPFKLWKREKQYLDFLICLFPL